MDNNKIGAEGIKQTFDTFKKLTNLKVLDVDFQKNDIQDVRINNLKIN